MSVNQKPLIKLLSLFVCLGWSAPSAIGIAGLGGGFEIGVEVGELEHKLKAHEKSIQSYKYSFLRDLNIRQVDVV